MNLLMPLCLRVGSGRKDVNCMREIDIRFALSVILNAMSPPASKSHGMKTTGSGSFTGIGRNELKMSPIVTKSLYQVSFLALKSMLVCFESELVQDWPRIARTIRDLSKVHEARTGFWNFIDFIVSQRCPLFVLLRSFIQQKLSQPPLTEHERHMHFVLREKLTGLCPALPKSRGALLTDLMQQMKNLKEDLEKQKKFEQTVMKKTNYGIDPACGGFGSSESGVLQGQRMRGSSIIDLLTGTTNNQNIPSNTLLQGHRGSVSSAPGPVIGGSGCGGRGSQDLSVSSISCDTRCGPVENVSPGDESSSEVSGKPNKPRLQRSKAQSRKTFRFRKSRIEQGGHHQHKYSGIHGMVNVEQPYANMDSCHVEAKMSTSLGGGNQQEFHSQDSIGTPDTPTNLIGSPCSFTPPTRASLKIQSNNNNCRVAPPPLTRSDMSWEEDSSAPSQTSSTSGYRENLSLLMMALDSPPPEFQNRPSTSSSTVVPLDSTPSSSPDLHRSILMVYDGQDEDTLI